MFISGSGYNATNPQHHRRIESVKSPDRTTDLIDQGRSFFPQAGFQGD